ncbi:DUF3606 domain-containing protein [Methylobacterium aerolatum]|nr:DUF3606 domain-containing protein [Methylobacterium aerolatum]GJD34513.1 hypothetical protein FMGBMHLM_1415 [Methylobacterium aerolatum]
MSMENRGKSHVDIFDRASREAWAQHFGVSEERLRKAVSMVGTRITSITAYLHRPSA